MRDITVNQKLCKGCGICAELCPKQVFEQDIDGRPVVARLDDCVGCRLCELRCPDFALKVEGQNG